MANRCPDCAKFVSLDDPEVSVESEDVGITGTVDIDTLITLNCAECGTGLYETSLNIMEDFKCEECGYPPLEVSVESAEGLVTEEKRKKQYGAEVEMLLTCSECGKTWSVCRQVAAPLNDFDEL